MINYESGGARCLQPCFNREAHSVPGSSTPEPANRERAISRSICSANYSGIRARRGGRERVRREITVISEGDPDMLDMPDEAIARSAPYESARPTSLPPQAHDLGERLGDRRVYEPSPPCYEQEYESMSVPRAEAPVAPQRVEERSRSESAMTPEAVEQ